MTSNSIFRLVIQILLISLTFCSYEIDLIPSTVYGKKYQSSLNEQSPKDDELFLMKVKMGYPPQTFHLLVDTNTYPIWVQESTTKSKISDHQVTFNKEISQSHKMSNMKFNIDFDRTDRIKGEFMNEKVNFGPETIQMDVLLTNEYTSTLKKYDGILGVAKSFPQQKITASSSLVPALESYKKTDSSLFSIHYLDPKAPKIIIGKAHEDFSKEKHTAFCDTLKKMNDWSCMVKKLIYNNTAITLNHEIYFDSSVEKIYFPDHLKDIFKSIISKKNCKEYENEEGAYFDCITLDDWLPFAFSFGDSVLKFPKEMLTKKYENNDFHRLMIVFTSKYRSEIHFGTSFFKHYHLLFDRNNKKITFYSPSAANVGVITDFKLAKSFFIEYVMLMAFIAVIGLSFGIIFKVVRTKVKKSFKKKFHEDFDATRYSTMDTLNQEVKV